MKTFIIGDIHGCFTELQELLDKAGILDDDLIIALGDIVDRGPDLVKVLDFFCNHPTRLSLMGNHERKHVRGARHEVRLALSQIISREEFGPAYPHPVGTDGQLSSVHRSSCGCACAWLSGTGHSVGTAAGHGAMRHDVRRSSGTPARYPCLKAWGGIAAGTGVSGVGCIPIGEFVLYVDTLYNTPMTIRANNNVTYSCTYHVVWCPKYRRKVLVDGIDERLKQILLDVAKETACDLIELEVLPDHVHVLVGVDPQFGVHSLVKRMKGRSSRLLRQEFPKLKSRLPTLWTNSYFVATVGGAPLSEIKQYIENQKRV